MANHSDDIDGLQNAPSDLYTCLLSPQIATSDKSRTRDISLKSPLAPTTPAYSTMSKQVLVTTYNAPSPPRIITQKTQFEQIIGRSPVSQSTTKLHIVFDESASSTTEVPFSDTAPDKDRHNEAE